MKNKLRILYITMDPLESNTSANIRNRGLILGLKALGHTIDTVSMELDKSSVGFDASLSDIADQVENRYYFKANALYKKMRTKKRDSYVVNKRRETLYGLIKSTLRKNLSTLARFILDRQSAYDIQRINAGNIKRINLDLGRYDVMISSSDPKSAHLAAEKLLRQESKKIVWIQYWGDPFYDDITGRQGRWSRYLRKKAELSLLKKADRVIYTSPFTLKRQRQLYPMQKQKMQYSVQATVPVKNTSEKLQTEGKLTIGYFGNYSGRIRNIKPLYTATDKEDIQLVICGEGDTVLNRRNITYYNRLEYKKAVQLEKEMDILICLCNTSGTQIPGKIYYTAGYQKPVIIVLDGESTDRLNVFFERFHRYLLCENNAESIEAAVKQARTEIEKNQSYQIPEEMTPAYVAEKVLGGIQRKEQEDD